MGIEKSTFLFPYVFLSILFVSLVFFHGRSRNRWTLTGRAQIHCLDSHTPSDFVFKHWTSGLDLCCLYFPHSVNIYESSCPFSVVFINEAFDLYEKLSTKCLKTHCIGDQSSDQNTPCQDLARTEANWETVFRLKTRIMGPLLQHTQILENDGRSCQLSLNSVDTFHQNHICVYMLDWLKYLKT